MKPAVRQPDSANIRTLIGKKALNSAIIDKTTHTQGKISDILHHT